MQTMMFQGYSLAAVLLAISAILLFAEILLPTQGLLGLVSAGAALWAIVVCARQNAWAGLGLTVALALASPLIWMLIVKIWPHTFTGRRLILPPVADAKPEAPVRVGQPGITISELRPMGMCEFDGVRVEAQSEYGIVPPGTAVKVVALVNSRPTVRIV